MWEWPLSLEHLLKNPIKGLKRPLLPDVPTPFEFSGLDEAKRHLRNELAVFKAYFANNPSATFIWTRIGGDKKNESSFIINTLHLFKRSSLLQLLLRVAIKN